MNAITYGKKQWKKHWFWIIVNVAALIPLLRLVGDFAANNMIDPISEMTNVTGYTGLVLLVLSLAVTPILSITGYRKVSTVRKSLGLQGFMYITLHLFIFVGLDYGFNLDFLLGDAIFTKQYVLVGFGAFLILVPLAITSTKGWMKRLGKNWKRLHRLVYLAVSLGVLHYFLVEKIPIEPVIWATVVGLLLVARVPPVRKQLNSIRKLFDGLKRKNSNAKPIVV